MARISIKSSINENQLKRNKERDISSWKFINIEPKGTRSKSILTRDKTTFLFKQPNEQYETEIEIFNSILANELDINHVQYFPAKYNGISGVVCERFLSHEFEELMEMKELLYRYSPKLQKLTAMEFKEMMGRDPIAAEEQNIENIYLVLMAETSGQKSIMKHFFRMIGFNALIGHTDRHWENYGILLTHNKKKSVVLKFAPLYDTVTTYLVGSKTDPQIEQMLKNELLDPNWYQPKVKNNCKIKIPGDIKTNHFDLLRYIVKSEEMMVYKEDLFWAFERFSRRLVVEIFKRFFPTFSEIRKKAIIEILVQRQIIGNEIRKSI